MRHILLLLMMISVLISCTKFGRTITVKGRVINPVTGEGIQGAKMILQRGTADLPGGNKTVKSVYSDSNGNFELNKSGFRSYSASCVLDANIYYLVGWKKDDEIIYPMIHPKVGKIFHADYYIVSYGNIILDIENINCQGATDSMQFKSKYIYSSSDNSWSTYRLGCYSFLSASPSKVPAGYYYYTTKVVRSGITSLVYDTVFVPENGTATIHIDY